MNELMIEASGIRKQFGDLEVLKNIDLEIRSQEITSIVRILWGRKNHAVANL